MANNRIDRISAEYQRALADALHTVKDPRVSGMTTITRCEVTGDLRYAKVYISSMGAQTSEKELMKGLKAATGYLRRTVSQNLALRASPEPVFHIDDSIKRGAHMLELLGRVEDDVKRAKAREEAEAAAAAAAEAQEDEDDDE